MLTRLLLLLPAVCVVAACEAQKTSSQAPPTMVGTDLLKGNPRAERIIQKFGGAEAYNLIQSATTVEIARVVALRNGVHGLELKESDYAVRSKVKTTDDESRLSLQRIFVDPKGGLCPCRPIGNVRIRFINQAKHIDLYIDFRCSKFGVYRDGKWIGVGSFGLDTLDMVRIFRRMLPDDKFLRNLEATGSTETPQQAK